MRHRIGQSRSDVWSELLMFVPAYLSARGADAPRSPKARRPGKCDGRQAICPDRQELADTLPSDGDLTRAEVVDGVVDPFLAVNIHVEQLCARDLDSRDAFGRFGAD
jgi:hypothetical protein